MEPSAAQRECIETFGVPLAVAAGAGSGKTYTLTRRIVRAIEAGVVDGIDQVLAITFTNKAARELADRVKGNLRQAGRTDQSLKVDGAWISTIHGMCSRLLRAHALELGIDPMFSMPDEERTAALLDDCVGQAVQALAQDSDDGAAALYQAYRPTQIRDMARSIAQAMSACPLGAEAIVMPPAPQSPQALLERALAWEGQALEIARGAKESSLRNAWIERAERAMALVRETLDKASWDGRSAAELIAWLPEPSARFGSKQVKEETRACLSGLREVMREARLAFAAPHLEALVRIAAKACELGERALRSEGLLTNDDLVRLAARALEDHPAIAREMAGRFGTVMIDEFQDTDQVQVDMAMRMSGEGGCRLCVVGDGQQSIYRFRGADVSVWRRHLRQVEAGPGKVAHLFDNYRSHADVLHFADALFSQPAAFGASYESLAPHRDESRVERPWRGSGPRIEVQVVTGEGRKPGASADDVAARQARGIAESLAKLAQAGHRPGEMVVLLRSMSRAQTYADALAKAGLPAVVTGGSVLSKLPEARYIPALAAVLADPCDDPQMLAVLASPLFEVPDGDIWRLSRRPDGAKGPWTLWQGLLRVAKEAPMPADAWSPQARRAAEVLADAIRDAQAQPLARVMEGVLAQSGYLTRQERRGAAGIASAANAYKVIRMADDLARSDSLGPRELSVRLAAHLDSSREAPGALSAEDSDFVRIMTVHASKGLEFPIVAISQLGSPHKGSSLALSQVAGRPYVSLDAPTRPPFEIEGDSKLYQKCTGVSEELSELDEDELAERVAKAETPGERRESMQAFEAASEASERVRLLYVAVTRAKEAVILSIAGTRSKDAPDGRFSGEQDLVRSALVGERGVIERGTSILTVGDAHPVRVRVSRVDLPEEADGSEPAAGASERGRAAGDAGMPSDASCHGPAGGASKPAAPSLFVPTGPLTQAPIAAPYALRDRQLFSYSSLASAGVDRAELAERAGVAPVVDRLAAGEAPLAEDDDAREDPTSFGSAFHQLARLMARSWEPGCPLRPPAAGAIRRIARLYGLDDEGMGRLSDALGRWAASDVAARAATSAQMVAEMPFTERLPLPGAAHADGTDAFLWGDVDLLCVGASGDADALIVDYKTGGSDLETPGGLAYKHLLQASCYALSALRGGFPAVELAFVRVERASAADPSQPVVVPYRFDASDLPWLEEELAAACAKARKADCGEPVPLATLEEEGARPFAAD